jgi:hypothetical protein
VRLQAQVRKRRPQRIAQRSRVLVPVEADPSADLDREQIRLGAGDLAQSRDHGSRLLRVPIAGHDRPELDAQQRVVIERM